MRLAPLLALTLLAAGLGLLAWGLPREGGEVHFVVVFPVFVLRGPLTTLGAFLLFFGLFLGSLSLLRFLPARLLGAPPPAPSEPVGPTPRPPGTREDTDGHGRDRRFGGVVLLGPVPIVFGSDARVTTAMLILALALTVLLVLLYL